MKKYKIIILIVSLVVPLNIYAEEVTVNSESPTVAAEEVEKEEVEKEEVKHELLKIHKRGSYIAPMIGYAISNTEGGVNVFLLGARLGTELTRNDSGILTLGLMIATASDTQTVSGVKIEQSLTPILLEFISRQSFDTGLYFGARLGVGLLSVDITSGSTSLTGTATQFAYAPVIGFEAPIGYDKNLNVLFDFSWLNFSKSTLNIVGTKLELDSSSDFTLMAGIQYLW